MDHEVRKCKNGLKMKAMEREGRVGVGELVLEQLW